MAEVFIQETEESVIVEQGDKRVVYSIPLRDDYEEILQTSDDSMETTFYNDITMLVDDSLEDEEIQLDDEQFNQLVQLLCEKHGAMFG